MTLLCLQVVRWCKERDIGLVLVGPEAPLVAGLVDSLKQSGIRYILSALSLNFTLPGSLSGQACDTGLEIEQHGVIIMHCDIFGKSLSHSQLHSGHLGQPLLQRSLKGLKLSSRWLLPLFAHFGCCLSWGRNERVLSQAWR